MDLRGKICDRAARCVEDFWRRAAVSDLSLKIEKGAFFVLAGPSGCGKSTVLRMINALIASDRGDVFVRGENVQANDPEKLRRGIGYVIQSAGLFPHWTAADNILAVPRLLNGAHRNVPRGSIRLSLC